MPLIFLFRDFKIKDWRRRGVNSFSASSASSILALPVFITMLFYIILSSGDFIFSKEWLFLSSIWSLVCFTTGIVSIWILKKLSFTQLGAFSKVISFVFSLLSDIFIFKNSVPIVSLIFLSIILLAGINIKGEKDKVTKKNQAVSLFSLMSILIILESFNAVENLLLKQLAIIQTNPLFFAAFLQTIIFSLFVSLGLKPAIKDIKNKKISISDIIYTNLLIVIYCLMEPYVLKSLPLVIITTLGIVKIAFSYVYDVKAKDLNKNKKSILYLIMIFIGVVGLMVIKH
jgi:hypothetical protein